jgi:hypothetical protein
MPVDFDFWRGAGDEIQFLNAGTMRTLGSSSGSITSGCSYSTASLPALCQLILDFITFRAASLLQDVRFSTQLWHETDNMSSSLKCFFPCYICTIPSTKTISRS